MSNDLLIDKIYEAAVMPSAWKNVLDELGQSAGCENAVLYTTDGMHISHYIANERAEDMVADYVRRGLTSLNPWDQRLLAWSIPEFVVDEDLFGGPTVALDDFFKEWSIPAGAAWGTGSSIHNLDGNVSMFGFFRRFEAGPVKKKETYKLTALRPHLARAALVSQRLVNERTTATITAFQAMGLPAAALRSSGVLRTANTLFMSLMPGVVRDGPRGLQFVSPTADDMLRETLSRPQSARTIPVRPTNDESAHIAHVLPITGAARDVFTSLDVILVIVPVASREHLPAKLLQGLFDLTPTEARTANAIISGRTIADFSTETGIALNTVRFHLKNVMIKTGTTRQAELVSLLANIPMPPSV